MAKPPSSNIRLTISVAPEVHAAFQRMAEVSGMSIGRCMGEWLGDTLEGVQMITGQLARAREAPKQVIREMRQGLLGTMDEMDTLLSDMRSGKVKFQGEGRAPVGVEGSAPAPAGVRPSPPRPVIRGGKSPGKTRRT